MRQPNITETLQELDAGLLASKLSKVLADVALGVIQHSKLGKVTLTLDLKQIAESAQINVQHKISYQKPTLRGKVTEEDTTTTPMYANTNGHLTVAPENQLDLFKTAQQEEA